MRTDNRNVKNTIISIYFLFMVVAILFATVFSSNGIFPKASMYVFQVLFVIIGYVHFIARYFEYDSDGAKLVFVNRGLILIDLINYRQHRVEFAKHKFKGYKVRNYVFYKKLVISIQHSNGRVNKESFNVTLIKPKKLRYIKQSLKKILKENKKHKQG